MNLDEYSLKAKRTINLDAKFPQLLNGGLGLAGEAGEVADIVKKHFFQGHELDEDKLVDELGDIMWYINLCALYIGKDISEILDRNIEKLEKRYRGKFEYEKSVNRES